MILKESKSSLTPKPLALWSPPIPRTTRTTLTSAPLPLRTRLLSASAS